MDMMITASWRLLRHFLAVIEHQSFTLAADSMHITQPAITKSIRELEERLGVPLFERTTRGALPTRYAEMLARRVRLMEIEYRHALNDIECARRESDSLLRIGAGPAWYSAILPPIIGAFLRENVGIRIRLVAGVPGSLVNALEAGEVDLVCTALDTSDTRPLVREAVTTLRHQIVASEAHALAGTALPEPGELAAYPWVVVADDHVGNGRILSYFAGFGIEPPRIMVETTSLSAQQAFIADGYLGHMPQQMLPNAARVGIRPLPIRGSFWESPAGMIFRQSEFRPRGLTHLINSIRAAFPTT